MPFYIYKKVYENGELWYQRQKSISLAGKNSPFKIKVLEIASSKTGIEDTVNWGIERVEMLNKLGYKSRDGAIVIDLKPKVKQNISLYEIKKVWGRTSEEWTPIALKLYPLYEDTHAEDVENFKEKFSPQFNKKYHVYEFLYLQGGYEAGSWVWGPIGSVNGVLLWPNTLEYFFGVINKDRRNTS